MISLIFPIYKVSEYIENCMHSVCLQNNKNFEAVLVNDGSPDDSTAKAEAILRKAGIAFQTVHQENSGLAAARNAGMRQANGDWAVCVDPDDVLCPDFLSFVEGTPLPVVIVNYKMVTRANPFQQPKRVFQNEIISRQYALKEFLIRKLRIIAPAIFLRKDFMLEQALKYDASVRFSEDQPFIWKVLFATEKLAYNKTDLYNYFLRENSIMTASGLEKILSGFAGFEAYCEQLEDSGEYPEITSNMLPRWLLGVFRSTSRMLTWPDFAKLLERTEYQKHLPRLLAFPEIKARALARMLKLSPSLFYNVCRKL